MRNDALRVDLVMGLSVGGHRTSVNGLEEKFRFKNPDTIGQV
jgi:hypothetical protein